MTLVSNIINALGGSPAFDDPSMIPSYPACCPARRQPADGEPGTVLARRRREDVHGDRRSRGRLDFPLRRSPPPKARHHRGVHAAIKQEIVALGDGASAHATPPDRPRPRGRVGRRDERADGGPGAQIDTIVEEGEASDAGMASLHRQRHRRGVPRQASGFGTPTPPGHAADQRYISRRRADPVRLRRMSTPCRRTPKAAGYPPRAVPSERPADIVFNYTYYLLRTLHPRSTASSTCSTRPSSPRCFRLKQQAMDMMAGNTTGGQHRRPGRVRVPAGPALADLGELRGAPLPSGV